VISTATLSAVTPAKKIEKKRLDIMLVERGLAESRQKAQALILAGVVSVEGERRDKAGAAIPATARIEVADSGHRYASRAGTKLEGALRDFEVSVADKICLDIGASTGGFSDCLLQHGAKRVFAVDVTASQMAWKLQTDPRVVQIEKNARTLQPEDLADLAELAVVDVSFISVAKILPAVVACVRAAAEFLILVKPQFELDRGDIGKGGIVRDPALHERAVERVRTAAIAAGLRVVGTVPSQLPGAEGNLEFFLYARRDAPGLR
jgi:23S rRNA (cytidine1920-2'-O)/16S rRNA (cytidine1409-2'-O)-methyltransferase